MKSLSRRSLILSVVSVFLAPITLKSKENLSEMQKIEALLKIIKESGVTFIRNGSEHTAQRAFEHLSGKLKSAQSSWFGPSKDEWTAKMFIEELASKSSFSGKPYMIKLKDGKIISSATWLKDKLKEISVTN